MPGSLDDAFIVLTYAKNLAEQGCLCYSATSTDVDGFTSLLDVLIKATFILSLRLDPFFLSWLATLIYLASAIALLAFYFTSRSQISLGYFNAALLTIAVAVSEPVRQSAAFQLEGPLFLVVLLSLINYVGTASTTSQRSPWVGGLLLLLAALVRPEGVVLWILPLAIVISSSWTRSRSLLLSMLAIAAFGYLAYLAWHIHRFGVPFPNTFYAKRSDVFYYELLDGLRYLARYLGSAGGMLIAAILSINLIAIGIAFSRSKTCHPLALPLICVILSSLIVAVLSGGDGYPGSRLLLIPVCSTLVLTGVALASDSPPSTRGIILSLLIAFTTLQVAEPARIVILNPQVRNSPSRDWPSRLELLDCERQFVRYLASNYGGTIRIGFTDFQRIRLLDETLQVVDYSGLNSKEIAHRNAPRPVLFSKFEPAILNEFPADVVILGPHFFSPVSAAPLPTIQELFHPHLDRPTLTELGTTFTSSFFDTCGLRFHYLRRLSITPTATLEKAPMHQ